MMRDFTNSPAKKKEQLDFIKKKSELIEHCNQTWSLEE